MNNHLVSLCLPLALVLSDTVATPLDEDTATSQQKLEFLRGQVTEPQDSISPELADLVSEALQGKSTDALYELAYATKGFSGQMKEDKGLGHLLLASQVSDSDLFAQELDQFIQSRSIDSAETLLSHAQSPRQRALAFLCLAEAHFAKGRKPKVLLYSLLSLGINPSPIHDKQVQWYITEILGEPISLLQSKDKLLAELGLQMEREEKSERFRLLFDMATVLGLVPEYPFPAVAETDLADPLQICVVFDNNYAKHAGVTILSAMLSANPTSRYSFNVLEDANDPLSDQNKADLAKLTNLFGEDRFQMSFHAVDDSMLPSQLHNLRIAWPRNVYFKMLIPLLFPDSERVLYMDTDLIARRDLTPLINYPMGDNLLLGTRDVCGDKHLKDLEEPLEGCYMNGGVVLFNVAGFQQEGKGTILRDTFENDPAIIDRLRFNEQDLMALLFKDSTIELAQQRVLSEEEQTCDSIWNWFAQKHPSTHWSNIHNHFAGIIHMESHDIKPWVPKKKAMRRWFNNPKENNGIQDVYFALRDMGPWPVSYRKRI